MANDHEMTLRKRQMLVGKTRQLLDAGYSAKEIGEKLGLAESTVRMWTRLCMEAYGKKSERYADNNVEE